MSITYKTSVFEDSNKILASLDKEKVSKKIMTKYEFDKIISTRATELSLNSIPFIKIDKPIKSNMELRKVAIKELLENKLPYIIKRPLPNSKFEFVRIRDLDLVQVKYLFDDVDF